MIDTIVAVSSGRPPAAIAILRVSGSAAMAAVRAVAGTLPTPRTAGLRVLTGGDGTVLDRALVLVFPGPRSATGEDLVELHCHGGRAVIAAVEAAVLAQPGCRLAEPGEFTRRALLNGRIDLVEAQGLADLLQAETEQQRRVALDRAEGRVSRLIERWRLAITELAAAVEAAIDYAEDEGVEEVALASILERLDILREEIASVANAPPVERWRDGVRVVIAGSPNRGKSTLLNRLAGREAAIVSDVPGTTRDRVEVAIYRDGVPYVLVDTAGLREAGDAVEAIGVARAEAAISAADVLLWLDPPPVRLAGAVRVGGRRDPGEEWETDVNAPLDDPTAPDRVWYQVAARANILLPLPNELALDARERDQCRRALDAIASPSADPLILAEQLRQTRGALGAILSAAATDELLDSIFAQFCLGK